MMNEFKQIEKELQHILTSFKSVQKPSLLAFSEKNNVLSKLEESLFWLNKVIAIHDEEEKRFKRLNTQIDNDISEIGKFVKDTVDKSQTITSTGGEEKIHAKASEHWNNNLCNYDSEGKATFNEMVEQCMKYKIPNLRYKDSYYTYTYVAKNNNHQWIKQEKNPDIVKKFADRNGKPRSVDW